MVVIELVELRWYKVGDVRISKACNWLRIKVAWYTGYGCDWYIDRAHPLKSWLVGNHKSHSMCLYHDLESLMYPCVIRLFDLLFGSLCG